MKDIFIGLLATLSASCNDNDTENYRFGAQSSTITIVNNTVAIIINRCHRHHAVNTRFQVTDIDMLRHYSSRGKKKPNIRSQGPNIGRDPQKLAQSAVLGLQFWVGAKHFREGRMEVRAKDEEKKCDQLIFKGVLFCLFATHIQHQFVDPCGGKVSGNCQYCK